MTGRRYSPTQRSKNQGDGLERVPPHSVIPAKARIQSIGNAFQLAPAVQDARQRILEYGASLSDMAAASGEADVVTLDSRLRGNDGLGEQQTSGATHPGRHSRRRNLKRASRARGLWRAALLLACLLSMAAQAQERPPMSEDLARGLQAYTEGRLADAIAPLDAARLAEPAREEPYAPLAAALVQTGQTQRAEQIADDGLRRFPDVASLTLIKAEILLSRGDLTAAFPLYERLARGPVPGVPAETIRARLRDLTRALASGAIEGDRTGEAIRWTRVALVYSPSDPDLHHALAVTLYRAERFEEAQEASGAGLRLAPAHRGLLEVHAALLARGGDAEATLAALERLYDATPGDVETGLRYAAALVEARNPRRAGEVVDALLAQHPHDTRIYDALVAINARAFNTPGVIATLRRRMAVFPDDPGVRLALAATYEASSDWADARGVLDTLATLPGQSVRARTAIARTYEAQDSLGLAADLYGALDAETGGTPEILRPLARVYAKLGAWTDARDATRRLIALAPTPEAWVGLGDATDALGLDPRDAFASALALDSTHARAAFLLARARHARGEEARPLAARAVHQSLADAQEAREIVRERGAAEPPQPGDEPISPSTRAGRLDALADSAFAFFSTAFAPEATEPTIHALLREWPTYGRLQLLAGEHYARHDDLSRAETYLMEAARLAPREVRVHLTLGALHERTGEPDRALLDYERARALDETAPEAYAALLRLASGESLDALIARWQSRLRGDPRNAVLREHLVDALNRAGRYSEAATIASGG